MNNKRRIIICYLYKYMALTSFKNDKARIQKQLEISTNTGRYQLLAPGPGTRVAFEEDPFIRLQKYGSNIRTDTLGIENDLRGLTKPLTRDQINYKDTAPTTMKIYCSSKNPGTEQSRATNPAWMYRGVQQTGMRNTLLFDPQTHAEVPFNHNTSSRIEVKNNYKPNYPCSPY